MCVYILYTYIEQLTEWINEWMNDWLKDYLAQNRTAIQKNLCCGRIQSKQGRKKLAFTHTHTPNTHCCQRVEHKTKQKIEQKTDSNSNNNSKTYKMIWSKLKLKQFCWKKRNHTKPNRTEKKYIKIYSDKPIKKMERNRDTQLFSPFLQDSRNCKTELTIYMNMCVSVSVYI